jgi:hypothetical protein
MGEEKVRSCRSFVTGPLFTRTVNLVSRTGGQNANVIVALGHLLLNTKLVGVLT